MSDVQRPTVGRIVHYYDQRRDIPIAPVEGPFAAIITAVAPDRPDGFVSLHVWKPYGISGAATALYSDAEPPSPGYWRWPPRV